MTQSSPNTKCKRRIALFASHLPGLKVAKYLSSSQDDNIVALYLSNSDPHIDQLIERECGVKSEIVFRGKQDYTDPKILEQLSRTKPDTIICVYWPWILPENVYSNCDITVNFHPALLPKNKGWYPHVHNLINGDQAGVTLHQLAAKADTGPI